MNYLEEKEGFVEEPPEAGANRGQGGGGGGAAFGSDALAADEQRSASVEKPHHQLFPGNKKAVPGDDDFDESDAHIQFVVNEWAQGTSIHGVANIADGLTWKMWKRMLWLVLVCGSGGVMIWQIEALIREYRNYEVVTDTETINPGDLEFPEVTICNLNSFSALRKNQTGIDTPNNETELLSIAQPIEEFIPFAFFNFDYVDPTDWKQVVTDFGPCWSYTTDKRIRRPGIFGGLSAYIFLDQEDYEEYSDLAGVMIWIEEPGTLITDQVPFFVASPGRESLFSIEKVEFQREKEAPWARCKSPGAPEYTQPRCRSECTYAAIRKNCGCRTWGDMANKTMRYCLDDDVDDGECIGDMYLNETQNQKQCDCGLPPCNIIRYSQSVAEAEFSQSFLQQVDNGEWGENVTRDDFLFDYVSVHINYAAIQSELLTESKAVTFAQLLGSIGGSMGLFLGISVLSIFEVFGDLAALRLLPRLFGHRNLNGLGAR